MKRDYAAKHGGLVAKSERSRRERLIKKGLLEPWVPEHVGVEAAIAAAGL